MDSALRCPEPACLGPPGRSGGECTSLGRWAGCGPAFVHWHERNCWDGFLRFVFSLRSLCFLGSPFSAARPPAHALRASGRSRGLRQDPEGILKNPEPGHIDRRRYARKLASDTEFLLQAPPARRAARAAAGASRSSRQPSPAVAGGAARAEGAGGARRGS